MQKQKNRAGRCWCAWQTRQGGFRWGNAGLRVALGERARGSAFQRGDWGIFTENTRFFCLWHARSPHILRAWAFEQACRAQGPELISGAGSLGWHDRMG